MRMETILAGFGFTYQDQVTQDGYLKYHRKDGHYSGIAVIQLKENGYKAMASVTGEGATILVK